MQILIVLILLVIAIALAPGFFLGLLSFLMSAADVAVFALIVVLSILACVYVWSRRSSDPVRQQAKEEKRIRKITDAANRANARKN